MPKITTCLTYNNQAEDAANLYVSVFPNSSITHVERYPEGAPMAGQPIMVSFQLDGQPLLALNGGPHFTFTDGISLSVDCESQAEVDAYWEKLSEGGEPGPCGWLKDRFGVSWQIVPKRLKQLLGDPDRQKAKRVMDAMLQMSKIDVAALERAAAGA